MTEHPSIVRFREEHEPPPRALGGRALGILRRSLLHELEREVRELRRANEILKTSAAFFAAAELDRKIR